MAELNANGMIRVKSGNDVINVNPRTVAEQVTDLDNYLQENVPYGNLGLKVWDETEQAYGTNYLPNGTGGYYTINCRKNSTTYVLGAKAITPFLPSNMWLVCIGAGTTGASEPVAALGAANIGGIVTDGGVTWAVDGVVDCAAAHNGKWRAANITDYYTSGKMSEAIADGSFRNIYIGDYITKTWTFDSTTYTNDRWDVVSLNYFLNYGSDPVPTANHVVLMRHNSIPNIRMHSTTTFNGYKGTEMWTTTIPKVDAGVKAAFGNAHVLQHSEYLMKAVNATAASMAGATYTGCASSAEWTSVYCNIPNESMIYGSKMSSGYLDRVDCPHKFSYFNLLNSHVANEGRQWFWLRDVFSSSTFCIANHYGNADHSTATNSYANGGLRPYFLFV